MNDNAYRPGARQAPKSRRLTKEKIREAAEWPTVREIAEQYGVPIHFVKSLWNDRLVEAVRLNTIRINPASFEEYVAGDYRPGV